MIFPTFGDSARSDSWISSGDNCVVQWSSKFFSFPVFESTNDGAELDI